MTGTNTAPSGLVVGVDASRNRSGGAKAHLIGLLGAGEPARHGIAQVHLWSYASLLDAVPDRPWLVKHAPPALAGALPRQVLWQRYRLPREAAAAGVDIMLDTDAGTVSTFRPAVTMSRDMLSYEPGEIERFGLSKARLRLELLRLLQNRSLRRADGAIFLTRHAAEVIQRSCGPVARIAYIPHGIGDDFKAARPAAPWPATGERPVRCLYVSSAALYKHQWHVVDAVARLRAEGRAVTLQLVGGGAGPARRRLDAQIAVSDPDRAFVEQLPFVPHGELPGHLAAADLFVFASSCENMPNTLVEAMAVGLPIACAERGPMPEVLRDGGVYFDPEDPATIAAAIARILDEPDLRTGIAARARGYADAYSWTRCADETWRFLAETHQAVKARAAAGS